MTTQFNPTWNISGYDFSCIKANVIDVASGSGSTLLDLQVGGTSKFNISKTGTALIQGDLRCATGTNGLYFCTSGNSLGRISMFGNDFYIDNASASGVINFRTGVAITQPLQINTVGLTGSNDTLLIVRSTAAQTLNIANTYTSSTNYEYGTLKFTSNEFRIGTSVGSAGGTQRETIFGNWNAAGTWAVSLRLPVAGGISGPTTTAWSISSGTPIQAATTTAGNNLTLQASSAVVGSSTNGAAAGGSVFIYAGDGTRLNSGTAAGGDITIRPGTPSIGGTPGTLYLTGAVGSVQSAGGDVRITGGTATQINNNLQMGHVYISTVGSDNLFLPGTIVISTGFGTRSTNSVTPGGNGGLISQTTGYGGANDFGGGNKTAGNGGAFTFTTGYGGACSTGTSNLAGNGGAYSITTGVGGAATGTASTGGNGGAFTITTGAGGAGATTNGNGGNLTFTAGIAGAGAGTAGVAGTITFNQAGVNKMVFDASGLTVNQQSASVIAQSWVAAASPTANTLEVRSSSGNIIFYVGADGKVCANRNVSANGYFETGETGAGYSFQGGWGGLRANSSSPSNGNLLNSPYGWELRCGAGYGVHVMSGTNPMFLDVYNTFTSTTNLEKGRLLWTSNEWRIGTAVGSAGGTQRSTVIGTWNAAGTFSPKIKIPLTGNIILGGITTDYGNYSSPQIVLGDSSNGIGTNSGTLFGRANSQAVWSANSSNLWISSTAGLGWSSTGDASTSADTLFYRDAAGSIAQRNGTNAQTFNVSNTYTSSTNYEYGTLKFTSNEFRIGTSVGSAGGTQRDITIGTWNSAGTYTAKVTIPISSTGAFYLGPPADSTTTGGNARGAGSVDLQTTRTGAGQVASASTAFLGPGARSTMNTSGFLGVGIDMSISGAGGGANACVFGNSSSINWRACGAVYMTSSSIANFTELAFMGVVSLSTIGTFSTWSCIISGQSHTIGGSCLGAFIGAGLGNTVSANYGFVGGGNTNTVSGQHAHIVTGTGGLADRFGMEAKATGTFSASGDAQKVSFGPWRNKTTDATPTTLFLDGSAQRLTVPSGKIITGLLNITGIKSDGSSVSNYVRKIRIKNVAGTTSLIGSPETIGTDYEDNPSTDITITADDTNDAISIVVTGIAGETWRWVAVFEVGCEIAYGT